MIIKKIILIMALSCLISNSKAADSIVIPVVGLGCLGGSVYMATKLWKAVETALEGNAVMLVNSGFNILGWSPKVPITVSAYGKYLDGPFWRNETPEAHDVLRYLRIRYGAVIGWGLGSWGLLLVSSALLGVSAAPLEDKNKE